VVQDVVELFREKLDLVDRFVHEIRRQNFGNVLVRNRAENQRLVELVFAEKVLKGFLIDRFGNFVNLLCFFDQVLRFDVVAVVWDYFVAVFDVVFRKVVEQGLNVDEISEVMGGNLRFDAIEFVDVLEFREFLDVF
jgi:hypothetical protein